MTFNEAVRCDAANAVLCWLATVDRHGAPSVTPKEIFALHGDDRVVIADIASSGSVRNVLGNPAVCVSFVDIFRQHGFKLNGTARIVPPTDPEFETLGAELRRKAGPGFVIRNLIDVRVERIARIRAPSYVFHPDRSEADMVEHALRTYGVRRAGG